MIDAEIREAITMVCAGRADADAQLPVLADCDDPQVDQALRQQVHLDGLLRARHLRQVDLAGPVRRRLQRRQQVRRRLVPTVLAAAALVMLAGGAGLLVGRPEVAVWGTLAGSADLDLLRGDTLIRQRPTRLLRGDRLRLAGDATVTCHGPAGLELELTEQADLQLTRDGGLLVTGRVRFRQADPTVAVVLTTPHGRFSGRAVAAIVTVTEEQTDVSVTEGVLASRSWRSTTSHQVAAGQSLIVDQAGSAVLRPVAQEPLPPLICRFDFEAIEGKEIPDVSGNGHRAWVYLPRPPTTGRHGKGLWCDGDAIMQVAHHPDLHPPEGSFAIWVKPHLGIPNLQDIFPGQPVEFFSKADWQAKRGWEMLRTAEGPRTRWGLRLCRGPGDLPSVWAELDSRLEWMHLAATWGNGRLCLYMDGEQVAEAGYDPGPVLQVDRAARVGTNIRGVIDDVRLYGEALTPQQIRAIHRAGGGLVGD